MKSSATKKVLAALLCGGMLLGSGNCVPDNFWVDLAGGAVGTAVETAIGEVVVNAISPGGVNEVLLTTGDDPIDVNTQ